MIKRTTRRLASILVIIIGSAMNNNARASLTEDQLLMVYNSKSSISNGIKRSYLAVHPNVHVLDLAIEYSNHLPQALTLFPPCDSFTYPGADAMTEFYATFASYETYIRAPVASYLAAHGQIRGIVTTRGIPAAISDLGFANATFASVRFHNGTSEACGGARPIISVESALAYPMVPIGGTITNPYYGQVALPFEDYLNHICNFAPSGFQMQFLTSRLDSSDTNGGQYLANIQSLISRSANLKIKKSAVVTVFDYGAPSCNETQLTEIARRLRDEHWCVYYDSTDAFLDGVNTPGSAGCGLNGSPCGDLDPAIEGVYQSRPELVHATLGRNHAVFCGVNEPICAQYVRYYNAHSAGLFFAYESFGGVSVREPSFSGCFNEPSAHGSDIDWIAAGGSFTIGNINGPNNGVGYAGDYIIGNLYLYGMCWGEAVWSGMGTMRDVTTPIGDPLARVVITDDAEAFDCTGYPAIPGNGSWPTVAVGTYPTPCGDVNHDYFIDQADVDLVIASLGAYFCPRADVNRDGVIDSQDIAVILHSPGYPHLIGDADGDGCIGGGDFAIMSTAYGSCSPGENYNPLCDLDCDGCVGAQDLLYLLQAASTHFCP